MREDHFLLVIIIGAAILSGGIFAGLMLSAM
jgi:hypothetical protein